MVLCSGLRLRRSLYLGVGVWLADSVAVAVADRVAVAVAVADRVADVAGFLELPRSFLWPLLALRRPVSADRRCVFGRCLHLLLRRGSCAA
jgi:hypothetical protein